MKRFVLFNLILFFCLSAKSAIIKWDGGGGTGFWATATNWSSNAVPVAGDDVVLDNSFVAGNYTITLPSGAINTTIKTITISPNSGNTIRLILPASNTAAPALSVNQGTGDVIIINNGGILENSNTAGSGTVISIAGSGLIRINNGGRYIHNNALSASVIVNALSAVAGTELGVFEYAQNVNLPLPSNSIVYGSIELTTTGTKIFTTTGSQDVTIKGFLKINTGVTFNSAKTGDFLIAGDLIINGNFDLSPSSAAMTRRLLFNGTSIQTISGSGNFTFTANFTNIEVNSGSTVTLQRAINLSNAVNKFIVNNGGTLQMATNVINGNGTFQLNSGGWLGIGSVDGITTTPTLSGNVQTITRTFPSDASYEYNGINPQVTGNGLPTNISGTLQINNSAGISSLGVTLTNNNTTIDGTLSLTLGKLRTSATSLLIISSTGTILPYSAASFVGGPLNVTGHPGFTFPIGINAAAAPTGSIYAPVTMNYFGGTVNSTDSYTAEYVRGNPQTSISSLIETAISPNPQINHISFVEYWKFFRVDGGTNTPTKQIVLEVNPQSICYHLNTLLVARYDQPTSRWKSEGYAGSYFDPASTFPLQWGHVSSNTTTKMSGYFTLSTTDQIADNPLPITLISFDASKLTNTTSSINWELASFCSAASKFEIQIAGPDKTFITVGAMDGSETNKLYNYTDNGLKNGINYYRLKMIDEDGKISYSRTVAIMNGVNGLLLTSLIPTMVNSTATLTIAASSQQKIDLVITDMQGRIVKKQNYSVAAGNTNIELSIERLAGGVYQLTGITGEGKTNVIRFIKQ